MVKFVGISNHSASPDSNYSMEKTRKSTGARFRIYPGAKARSNICHAAHGVMLKACLFDYS